LLAIALSRSRLPASGLDGEDLALDDAVAADPKLVGQIRPIFSDAAEHPDAARLQ
jgi:hypothetical protein